MSRGEDAQVTPLHLRSMLPGPWAQGSLPEECPHCLKLYWTARDRTVPPMPHECQRAFRELRQQGRRDRATEWWHALINMAMIRP